MFWVLESVRKLKMVHVYLGLRRDILFGVYPTNIHALSYILLGSFSTRATGVTVALLLEDITCVRVKLRCNHDLAEPYRP